MGILAEFETKINVVSTQDDIYQNWYIQHEVSLTWHLSAQPYTSGWLPGRGAGGGAPIPAPIGHANCQPRYHSVPVPVMYKTSLYCTGALYTFRHAVSTNQSPRLRSPSRREREAKKKKKETGIEEPAGTGGGEGEGEVSRCRLTSG